MIRKYCDDLLVAAAQRWPATVQEEMLTEWRAELDAATGTWRRLRYASSLALARPAERRVPVAAIALRLIGSILFITVLPMVYLPLSQGWTTFFSEDTIPGQTWIGITSLVVAMALGIICARMTSGGTQLIKPTAAPLWTFGLSYIGLWAMMLALDGVPDRSVLIDISCWALSGAVLSTGAAWLAIARRRTLSWLATAASVLVAFWFVHMHSTLLRFDNLEMFSFLHDSWVSGFAFQIVTNAWLHVTIFLTVYANYLAIRWHKNPHPASAVAVRA